MTKHYLLLLLGILLTIGLPAYSQTLPPNNVSACKSVLSFDGIDDYVNIPNGVYFDDNTFTIEAWVYIKDFNAWERIIDFGNGAATDNVLLSVNGDANRKLCLALFTGGGSQNIYTTATLPLNTWTHIAAVMDGTNVLFYIDGVLEGTYAVTVTIDNINRTSNFIGKSNWADPYFNGLLDEVRIWDVARTDTEIAASKDVQLAGTEANLIGYWDMNDLSGSTTTDKSSAGNSGALTNMDVAAAWQTSDGLPAVVPDITMDPTPCVEATATVENQDIVSYLWSDNSTSATFTTTSSGNYSVVITDVNGCSGKGNITILKIFPLPTIDAGSDVSLFCGETTTLNALATVTGANPNDTVALDNSTTFAIPDAQSTGVSSPIVVSDVTFYASDIIAVLVDDITHTYNGDLDIYLIAPNGSSILLSSDNGKEGNNYTDVFFSNSATVSIASLDGVTTSPITGHFLPEETFSSLTGSANGTWYLKVVDDFGSDIGSIHKWSLLLPTTNSIVSYSWAASPDLSSTTIFNPVAAPTTTSTYTVTITDAFGCSSSDDVTVDYCTIPTGVMESSLPVNSITLSPNPTNGQVTIHSKKQFREAKVFIEDLAGTKIYEATFHDTDSVKLDLSDKKAGMYILSIRAGEEILTQKLVLQK